MIQTIRARLTLWYMLLLFLTLVAFSVLTYHGVSQALYNQFDRSFSLDVQRFVEESELEDDGELDLETEVLTHGELVAVYDAQGELIVQHDGPPKWEGAVKNEGFDSYQRDGTPWRRITRFAPHLNLWLQVSRSQEELARSQHYLLIFLLAGVPATVLLAGVGGLFLASRLLNPLDKITRTAADLSVERLSQRLPGLKSRDELARLVETFNDMLARLDDSFARQKQFTSDAAHELRTPLARLLARAEVTLSRTRTEEDYRAALEEMSAEIKSTAGLLSKLLMIARDDAGTLQGEWERLSFGELVEDVVRSAEPLERGVTVRLNLARVDLLGDQMRLTELILNLFENAVRHSPDHGVIEVELSTCALIRPIFEAGRRLRAEGQQALDQAKECAVLRIQDQGPGVPQDLRERIFERFYQADESRHPDGAGLGLAICRAIARQHEGDVHLEETDKAGACFVTRIPIR